MLRVALVLLWLSLVASCAGDGSEPASERVTESEPESEPASEPASEPEPEPEPPAFRVERDFEPFVFPDSCFAAHAPTVEEAMAKCRQLRARGSAFRRRYCVCRRDRMIEVSAADPVAFYQACCWAVGDTPAEAHAECSRRMNEGWCDPTEADPPEDPAVVLAVTGPYERRAEPSLYESLEVHRYLVPRRVHDGGGMWISESGEPPCFVRGTMVALAEGATPIEAVQVGDRVLTERDGVRITVPVLGVKERTAGPVLAVELADRVLRVTPEHPLWVNGEWRPARELRAGDRLRGLAGPVTVRSIEVEEGARRVLTLRVGAPHTFFAGGVLVHNY